MELTDLEPNTTYYYVCGDEGGGWSPEYAFTTAPDAAHDFVFIVLGDMGITPTAKKNLDRMSSENPSCVLHAGDLSYANGFTLL